MKNKRKFPQKIVAFFLAVAMLLPSAFLLRLSKAEAQFVPVHDAISLSAISGLLTTSNLVNTQTSIATGALTIKEVGAVPGLNPLVYSAVNQGSGLTLSLTSLDFWAVTLAKTLIGNMTNSIVEWIDSGFQGSPAFVQDPGSYFSDIGDAVAGSFIEGTELGFLCDPFELDVRFLLNHKYQSEFTEIVSCRLTDVIQNAENFANFAGDASKGISPNFSAGGWNSWISLTRQNQYNTYIAAEAELSARIAGRQNIELLQLNWGSGFLSHQECEDVDENGNPLPLNECENKGPIKTPGTVIESGLNEVLGTELTELELADSIDKIVAALLNQLMSKALSDTGLVGN